MSVPVIVPIESLYGDPVSSPGSTARCSWAQVNASSYAPAP